jgi:hypothetical protein
VVVEKMVVDGLVPQILVLVAVVVLVLHFVVFVVVVVVVAIVVSVVVAVVVCPIFRIYHQSHCIIQTYFVHLGVLFLYFISVSFW